MPIKTRKKTTSSPFPWIILSSLLLVFIIISYFFEINISIKLKSAQENKRSDEQKSVVNEDINSINLEEIEKKVVPENGVELPIKWADLGKQMVEVGVIDLDKFRQLFGGNLSQEEEIMLTGNWNEKVIMNNQNSRFILDILWGLGLGNKNKILDEGSMVDKQYGGAGNFASTGGWTLSKEKAMDHYSKYGFISLTEKQQAMVEELSKGIYRPCCGNSTFFPDCNHGMAMLGLLELMASQGVSKEQMYKTALEVNSIWFPTTYIHLATYFAEQGQDWNSVDPKLVLGEDYSSAQGYQSIRTKIKSLPQVQSGGGGCGV